MPAPASGWPPRPLPRLEPIRAASRTRGTTQEPGSSRSWMVSEREASWRSWSFLRRGAPLRRVRLIYAEGDRGGGQGAELELSRPPDGNGRAHLVLVAVPVEIQPFRPEHALEDLGVIRLGVRLVPGEVVGIGERDQIGLGPGLVHAHDARERAPIETREAERVVELSDGARGDPEQGRVVGPERVHEARQTHVAGGLPKTEGRGGFLVKEGL